jgi:hypothetical protein
MTRDEVLQIGQEIHAILSSPDAPVPKADAIANVLQAHQASGDLASVLSLLIDKAKGVPTEAQTYATLAWIFCRPTSEYPYLDVVGANSLFRGADTKARVPKADVKPSRKRQRR